eukprot:gene25583-biopygen13534
MGECEQEHLAHAEPGQGSTGNTTLKIAQQAKLSLHKNATRKRGTSQTESQNTRWGTQWWASSLSALQKHIPGSGAWEKRQRTRTGRGPDAGRTIEIEETDADRTRTGRGRGRWWRGRGAGYRLRFGMRGAGMARAPPVPPGALAIPALAIPGTLVRWQAQRCRPSLAQTRVPVHNPPPPPPPRRAAAAVLRRRPPLLAATSRRRAPPQRRSAPPPPP